MKLCLNCKSRTKQKHHNSKWCLPCALAFRAQPRSTLTQAQIERARKMIGKMPAGDIAERLGVSVSSLKRAFRGQSIWFHNGKYKNRPELVKRVLAYYEKNGRNATAKAFPDVKVRSIVERPEYYGQSMRPRQTRWTDQELLELARMAGIISAEAQAEFFSRPGANAGSIKSVWVKRFKNCGGAIHGMSHNFGRHLVTKACRPIETRFWHTRRERAEFGRKIYLWVEMEKNLQSWVPIFIREAIAQMAEFQRWLFRNQNPKREIMKLIKQREVVR